MADKNGVYLRKPFNFEPENKPRVWQARWIWLSQKHFPGHQTCPPTFFCSLSGFAPKLCLFRKTVELEFLPAEARAWVSADTRYRLYINGKMAGRGPAQAGGDYGNTQAPDWWFYDAYDLTSLFKKGVNIITAEVLLGPICQADYSMGRGGFLFEARLDRSDGSFFIINSDETWRATSNLGCIIPDYETWRNTPNKGFIMPDDYDARLDPGTWHTDNYDDSRWPNTDVIADAPSGNWRLLPRGIPPLMECRILPTEVILPEKKDRHRFEHLDALTNDQAPSPAIVKPGGPVTFCLCFEREVTGYPQIHLEGAADTILEFGFQEMMGKDHGTLKYILRNGLQTHEGIQLRGFQFLRITVTFPAGKPGHAPLILHGVSANFTSYPVSYCGRFKCSDEALNRIWEAGRWTTQLCMQAYHLDSPIHQEGLGCTGDYMIESLISYYTFGATALARQDILRTAFLLKQKRFKMFHTSYSLLWVQMLKDYWDHAGDLTTIRETLPVVHGLLDLFSGYIGPTGLITEAPNYMFMDWGGEINKYNLHHPPCFIGQGYMTAFYHQALLNAALLCMAAGDPRQQEYERRARNVRAAFNNELWVPAKELYCDGKPYSSSVAPNKWLPPDEDRLSFSAHTNALAVAGDIAPVDRSAKIMRRIMEDQSLPPVQPYFMHYVFAALHKAGLFETYGFSALRRWQALLAEHPSSLKENWNWGDYSHAWSGTPTYQLMSRGLGISPLEPGFRKVLICPNLGDLDWMEGSVPTQHGAVEIKWKRGADGTSGRINVPKGMEAHFGFTKNVSRVSINGTVIRPNCSRPRGGRTGVNTSALLRAGDPGYNKSPCLQSGPGGDLIYAILREGVFEIELLK